MTARGHTRNYTILTDAILGGNLALEACDITGNPEPRPGSGREEKRFALVLKEIPGTPTIIERTEPLHPGIDSILCDDQV